MVAVGAFLLAEYGVEAITVGAVGSTAIVVGIIFFRVECRVSALAQVASALGFPFGGQIRSGQNR
jgi:uncharacterized protein (UPF0548 family)